VLGWLAAVGAANAGECPGNPEALGVSRTIVVDPTQHAQIGSLQYSESLPLADHEVVLTFDDGPLPPYTSRVLDILAADCIKATFFMVGRQVDRYSQLVQRAYDEGHTIANHSQNHPLTFNRMAVEQAAGEIEGGFATLRAALGDRGAVAPFFRIPGLLRHSAIEDYLKSSEVMTWSVDFLADDWKHLQPQVLVRRALARIEAKGRGILLLHDIQRATAVALPDLLRQLKSRGYRIVHVVPATAERPATETTPEQWVLHTPHRTKPESPRSAQSTKTPSRRGEPSPEHWVPASAHPTYPENSVPVSPTTPFGASFKSWFPAWR